VAPCETAWASESYDALHAATGDPLWRRLADAAFSVLDLEDAFPGYSEACYYDAAFDLHPHEFECVYVASAVLRTCLRRARPAIPHDLLAHGSWIAEDGPGVLRRCRYGVRRTMPFLVPVWRRMKRMLATR
jgi:hypothetical protein